jgi:1-acyl-sn-glycerol-3-phosphate acyltransferase
MWLQKTWYMAGRFIVHAYLKYMMRADVQHETPLPRGAKILVANHPSTSDPAFVTTLVKEQTSILILETLFKVPVFGQSLRMAGHVPVSPGNGRAALDEGIRLLKAGRTVVIFPEGVISPAEGGFHKAHTGAARLALASGAPVVPVGISLDQRHVRRINTNVDGKSEMGTWYLDGPYAMTVGEPVTFGGSLEDREAVRAVTGQIMAQIAHLSEKSATRMVAKQAAAKPAQSLYGSSPLRLLGGLSRLYQRMVQSRVAQPGLMLLMLIDRNF